MEKKIRWIPIGFTVELNRRRACETAKQGENCTQGEDREPLAKYLIAGLASKSRIVGLVCESDRNTSDDGRYALHNGPPQLTARLRLRRCRQEGAAAASCGKHVDHHRNECDNRNGVHDEEEAPGLFGRDVEHRYGYNVVHDPPGQQLRRCVCRFGERILHVVEGREYGAEDGGHAQSARP